MARQLATAFLLVLLNTIPLFADYGPLHEPELQVSIEVDVDGYLMGIAWDGEAYLVLDGGINPSRLLRMTSDGDVLQVSDIDVYAYSLFRNPLDEWLYVGTSTGDVFRITDLTTGSLTLFQSGLLPIGQSSAGMMDSGMRLLTMSDGDVTAYQFFSGDLLYQSTGFAHGDGFTGGSNAIAVDSDVLYTMDGDAEMLFAQSPTGQQLASYAIPYGDFAPSLSFTNHLVWMAEHAPGGGLGEFNGYCLRDVINPPATLTLVPDTHMLPASGGTINYSATLASSVPQTIPGLTFWTLLTTPAGNTMGPILNQSFNHPPLMNVTVHDLQLSVPSQAPTGSYLYFGYVGFWPNPALSSGFAFDKLVETD